MMLTTRDPLVEVARTDDVPALSVYVGVEPRSPNLDHVRIALKDAERDARAELAGGGASLADVVVPALDATPRDPRGRTFVVLATPSRVWSGFLPRVVPPMTVVATTPVLSPLADRFAPLGRFHVLAISQNHVRVLAGDRDRLVPMEVPGLPASRDEALRADKHEHRMNVHGGAQVSQAIVGTMHGYEGERDERKDDLVRFFTQVSAALDAVPEVRAEPLLLACVGYEAAIYRMVDRSPRLLDVAVVGNPDLVDLTTLHDEAWPLVAPVLAEHDTKLAAVAANRLGTGLADADLATILPAADAGRVETLFVDPDVLRFGRIDSGAVVEHPVRVVGDDELVSIAIAATLRHGGRVVPIGRGSPLGGHAVVASYRY